MRLALLAALFSVALPACRKAPDQDLERAKGPSPGEPDRRRALALAALGRYPEAEAAAADAITRDAELGPAYALYGSLVARRDAIEEAEQALSRARRWAPDSPSTLLLELEIAARSGDAPRERAAKGRLMARSPGEPPLRHQRALALLRTGDAPGAAEEARICLGLAAGNPPCTCVLGMAAAKLGGPPAPLPAACAGQER